MVHYPDFRKTFLSYSKTFLAFLAFWGFLAFPTFAYDTKNTNQWKVYESAKVDTSIPKWFKPMDTENLNDWLDILPPDLQKYRSQTQFMAIPAMGLFTPIVELDPQSKDYKIATKGGEFDYNKYLVGGPTIYPGTASVGNPGNTFIFAHSNFRNDKPGDFKTIFRLTYNIQKGDSILYYKKISWQRKQYTYQVTQSMLVNETDIRVMLPEKNKQELTLSACRPIGTAKQRWINRATLINEKNIDYEVKQSAGTTSLPPSTTPSQVPTTNQLNSTTTGTTTVYDPLSSQTIAIKQAVQSAIEATTRIL
jgi:LPXTG-site transpeptidase (sortase) family protein